MWQGFEEAVVRARAEQVWAVVTDVARHPELSGSGEITAIRLNGPIGPASTWEADIRVPDVDDSFVARSAVLVFDPPREFSWSSVAPPLIDDEPESAPLVTWWFRLSPHDEGTLVRHTFRVEEPRVGGDVLRAFLERTNRTESILAGMRQTLANLRAALEK